MRTLDQMLRERKASPEEALKIFDGQEAVNLEFMAGRWKGYEIKTGHPIEGLLEASGWYGKLFKSPEEVHPLLFHANNKTQLYSVNPMLIPLGIPLPKSRVSGILLSLLRPVLQTSKGRARMRMLEYRGKLTGAMIYDHKAIIDVFVKADEHTMLGAMDFKGDVNPYFFVLERDFTDLKLKF